MISQALTYSAGGKTLISTLYRMKTEVLVPGVLVFPDILGLGDHAHERARRLAELGYCALAMDLHGDGRVLGIPEAMTELEGFYANPTDVLQRGVASLEKLCAQPSVDTARIGAIGFCYGGTLALEMARSGLPLKALAGFHSVLRSSLNWNRENLADKKILICVGSKDPQIPPEQRIAFEQEMAETTADWQIHLYGGVYHSFTDWRVDQAGVPDLARYDAVADRRSWKVMEDLFSDAFS
ncbi:MAG TPA: dienelactone hydrolase family protein [Sphingomicrobium sp.]|nr:dienelactone hydrolase family protein [Sphingomicrobium sp.]